MKQLTKTERRNIYSNVLKTHNKLKHNENRGLCPMLHAHPSHKDEFPEFFLFQPSNNLGYKAWFSKSGLVDETYLDENVKNHQRIVLMFCIEMTR